MQDVDQITVKDIQNQQIPCIVSYKSSVDAKDPYSSYGVIIGSWEMEKAELRGWTWEPGKGFCLDSKITEQTIEMGRSYVDDFELESIKPLLQSGAINGIDAYQKEVLKEVEYPNNQEREFRRYYHNMSDNQIELFNQKYLKSMRKLQNGESNEQLKEYIEDAIQKGYLREMLQYMKGIFTNGG